VKALYDPKGDTFILQITSPSEIKQLTKKDRKSVCTILHEKVQKQIFETLIRYENASIAFKNVSSNVKLNKYIANGHLSTQQYLFFNRFRLGLLPRKGKYNTKKDQNIDCRYFQAIETQSHLMVDCPKLKFFIMKRHNSLCEVLYEYLHGVYGDKVENEYNYNTNDGKGWQPDFYIETENQILIIEVKCPYDSHLSIYL